MISTIVSAWGVWPLSRLRPLVGMLGAGVVAFGGALAAGATWAGAGDAAFAAWLYAAGGQEALRLLAGKVTP